MTDETDMIAYEAQWNGLKYARFFTSKAAAIRFAKQCAHDEHGGDTIVNRLDIGKINTQKIIAILNDTSPNSAWWKCSRYGTNQDGYVSTHDVIWKSEPATNRN